MLCRTGLNCWDHIWSSLGPKSRIMEGEVPGKETCAGQGIGQKSPRTANRAAVMHRVGEDAGKRAKIPDLVLSATS